MNGNCLVVGNVKTFFPINRKSFSVVNLLSAIVIVIVSYISYSLEFSNIDTFNRDIFQLININKSIEPKISTVAINVKNNFLNSPLKYKDLEILIDELKSHGPEHLVFIIEPNDITGSKDELAKIKKLFETNKIWLSAWITGRSGFKNFSQLNEFENYKYFFEYRLCLDTNGNFSPRRMILKYYNIQESLMSDALNSVGLHIHNSDYFQNSYE